MKYSHCSPNVVTLYCKWHSRQHHGKVEHSDSTHRVEGNIVSQLDICERKHFPIKVF